MSKPHLMTFKHILAKYVDTGPGAGAWPEIAQLLMTKPVSLCHFPAALSDGE
jgi:hypothetical protein